MRKMLIVVGILAALVAIEAVPASANIAPTLTAPTTLTPGIKPALEKKACPQRAVEWAEYDWHRKVATPGNCVGPYGSGNHGETQWVEYGAFEHGLEHEVWQVNLDAYGNQTYHQIFEE